MVRSFVTDQHRPKRCCAVLTAPVGALFRGETRAAPKLRIKHGFEPVLVSHGAQHRPIGSIRRSKVGHLPRSDHINQEAPQRGEVHASVPFS